MRKANYLRLLLLSLTIMFVNTLIGQPQNVRFNKLVHDFGDISLASGHHKFTFTFENTGKEPVLVQTVISSCGCTTPVWTKKPVMPGEKGSIEVTFLNDQGPYPFDKALTVYITGEMRPVILRIKGVVHDKPKPLGVLFPENFSGLSLRKSYIDLGNIPLGETTSETVEVANTTSRNIDIKIVPKTKGLIVNVKPSQLKSGQKGEIEIIINSAEAGTWGKSGFKTAIFVNGSEVKNKEFKITASIRDNFSRLSKEEKENAPLPMASGSSYDFGKVKAGTIVSCTFDIRNLGRRDLLIRKIESDNPALTFKYPGKIPPGQTAKIEITLDTSGEYGEKSYILTIISNSPSRPAMNLIVTGNVTR